MKKYGPLLAVGLFLVVWLVTTYVDRQKSVPQQPKVTAEDVKQETQQALATAKQYAQQQRDAYYKKMENELTQLEQRIDDLKARVEQAKAETRDRLNQDLEQLMKQRDAARKKLAELQSAGTAAWEDLKSGMAAALDDLHKSYERAVGRLGEP